MSQEGKPKSASKKRRGRDEAPPPPKKEIACFETKTNELGSPTPLPTPRGARGRERDERGSGEWTFLSLLDYHTEHECGPLAPTTMTMHAFCDTGYSRAWKGGGEGRDDTAQKRIEHAKATGGGPTRLVSFWN